MSCHYEFKMTWKAISDMMGDSKDLQDLTSMEKVMKLPSAMFVCQKFTFRG